MQVTIQSNAGIGIASSTELLFELVTASHCQESDRTLGLGWGNPDHKKTIRICIYIY